MRTVTRTAPSSCRLKHAHARNEPFLQGKVDHHHGLEKQAIWPLHIHKKVATALQIQQLLNIQNLTLSFSCCETTWRCGPPTPPRKARKPKRALTTSLLFFSTISSRYQVWVLSFLKWPLLHFHLVATYSNVRNITAIYVRKGTAKLNL